jgi:hypothetical protein
MPDELADFSWRAGLLQRAVALKIRRARLEGRAVRLEIEYANALDRMPVEVLAEHGRADPALAARVEARCAHRLGRLPVLYRRMLGRLGIRAGDATDAEVLSFLEPDDPPAGGTLTSDGDVRVNGVLSPAGTIGGGAAAESVGTNPTA